MSWKGYTDKLLASKGCTGGGIYGHNGGTWAVSGTGISATAAQIKAWVAALQSDAGITKLREAGFWNGDEKASTSIKYILLTAVAGDKLVGKKGNAGICVMISAKAIVVGVYDEKSGIQPPLCVDAVGKLIAELKGKGF